MNAVRLIAFDPLRKSPGHSHTDFNDPAEVAALPAEMDAGDRRVMTPT
ncbi:MAG TPA: hypothetical protein VFB66_14475 [Tepidisphaeraceae bacterium]|nr:hypothetical protein [Tepidisphaeraceae bacterium]